MSRHRGGVALFYRPTPRFTVEVVEKCGPNVMVWQVVTGDTRWYIVGAYIAPADEGTTNGIYTRGSDGYTVIATDAPSRHRGGVALFYCPTPRFAVEAVAPE